MPTNEEINVFARKFFESMPRPFMGKMDKTNFGIGLVLRYLMEAGHPVSAGEISRYMHVSTARVAVILRCMSEKDLIIKQEDSSDARKTLVSLSESGKEHIKKTKAELMELMTEVITKVGIERMEQYLEISKEINTVVSAKMAKKKE